MRRPLVAILLLFAAPAAGQDAANISVNLAPVEVAAIQRALDRQPIQIRDMAARLTSR